MSKTASEICEDILRKEIEYNEREEILGSETAVAKLILSRGGELTQAYDEIYAKLGRKPNALTLFMGMLLSLQAFWSTEKIAQARQDLKTLQKINEDIEQRATELAKLLERRDQLHNYSGFAGNTLYHIVDIIERANKGNGFYSSYLRHQLLPLANQFDLKYWPDLSACMKVLADDAAEAKIEATDPLTQAATVSQRASPSDTVWALLAYIEENKKGFEGSLPSDFSLTDKTISDLLNVILDLPPEKLLTAEQVKGARHRAKRRQSGEHL